MIIAAPLRTLGAALADRVNPIVVREARQAVRSRAVVAAMMLLLCALVVVTGAFALLSDVTASASEARGHELFLEMNAVVMVLCVVFVPIYTAWRFAGEHSGASADLLQTTTVRPSSVVWGKLVVAMMVALLMFSVAAPFLTLTYLFRGIDLGTIAFVIGLDLVILLLACQIGVFIAAMRISAGLRIILGIIAIPAAIGFIISLTQLFSFGLVYTMMSFDEWVVFGLTVGFFLALGGLLFCLSVATTAPATTNRARLPRVYLTILWVASLIAAWSIDSSSREYSFDSWYEIWMALLGCAIVFAGAERRTLGPRLLRLVPRTRIARIPAFLFTSGAAAGIIWATVLVLASIGVYFVGWNPSRTASGYPSPGARSLHVMAWASIPGFAIAFTLIAAVFRDCVAKRMFVGYTAPLAMFLAAACSIIPIVVSAAINPRRWDRETWHYYGNPFGAVFTLDEPEVSRTIASIGFIAGLAALLLFFWWFRSQIRAFKPLTTESDLAGNDG